MSSPTVSVVMPVRDGQAFLNEAIRSLRAQTYRDIEIVVVDDGSKDGTAEILRRHGAEDPRLRIVAQAPAGIVTALNRGIAEASGALIARMDADDVALPQRLARQVETLSHHPGAALVGSGVEVIDRSGRALRLVHVPCAPEQIREGLERVNCIAHPTVLMRRDAVLAVGGYRHAFLQCEDYDLWLRLSERYDLLNIDEPLLRYREHSGQQSWQALEQRILSEQAARAAARCRRAGEADGIAGDKPITRRDLQKLGLSDAEIGSHIVARSLDAAREAGRAGNRSAVWAAYRLARRQGRLAWPIAARFWLACVGVLR